jgi:hypothetical protein
MKSTYTAIRCIMLDFWDHSQGECAASSNTEQQLALHKAELFAPRNLSLIDMTEPRCIHVLGGGRVCFLHAVRGEVMVSNNATKPGVLELVQQQQQLASSDDVFYVSTGRWYTHNCTGFEAPVYNASLWALATHYQVGGRGSCLGLLPEVLRRTYLEPPNTVCPIGLLAVVGRG